MDAPRLTSTHSVTPSRTRITKVRSVVVATDEGGRNIDGRGLLTGQTTSGTMPGASRLFGLLTSSSTGIVRVFSSSALLIRRTSQLKVSPGKAGTVKLIFAPSATPETFASGTGTTRRKRETCCNLSIGGFVGLLAGLARLPLWTLRSVMTPSKGAVMRR